MLCRKFDLIPMKFGFFYEFLKLLKNLAKIQSFRADLGMYMYTCTCTCTCTST